jgi:hypothetical protein
LPADSLEYFDETADGNTAAPSAAGAAGLAAAVGAAGAGAAPAGGGAGKAFLAEVGIFLVTDGAGRLHRIPFVVAGLQAILRARGSGGQHETSAGCGSAKRDELLHGITSVDSLKPWAAKD